MAYSNKFVACVVVDGRVQKELENGTVKIPFGSEYTLRFRNKHDRRAVVQFFIDGENVSDGGYIVQPHSKIDIQRHAAVDRSFRFVELDSEEAVEHGKDGPNLDKKKGLIEARFSLEKKLPPPPVHIHHHPQPCRPQPWYPGSYWNGTYGSWCSDTIGSSITGTRGDVSSTNTSSNAGDLDGLSGASLNYVGDAAPVTPRPRPPRRGTRDRMRSRGIAKGAGKKSILRSCSMDSVPADDGCTVEGSATGQSFYTTHIDLEDSYTTVKLFMQGYDPALVETAPVQQQKGGRSQLGKLERENEELRLKLAKIENERLKAELDA